MNESLIVKESRMVVKIYFYKRHQTKVIYKQYIKPSRNRSFLCFTICSTICTTMVNYATNFLSLVIFYMKSGKNFPEKINWLDNFFMKIDRKLYM